MDEIKSQLLKIAEFMIFSTPHGYDNESANLEGILLLHIMLQNQNGDIDSYLQDILDLAAQRYEMKIKHEFLKARILGVFLSALIYNCQLTIQKLSSMSYGNGVSYLNYILNEIISNYRLF